MKKLKLVGILVAVVLIGGVISISFINNNIAYKVEKELCETPLPEKTELIESISRAGKLTGNGNGMQYFGAILIQSELSLKEPEWPFGSASGRLVLKEGKDKISQTDFELHNDGASISSSCWKVTWHEDYVEIILSGEEQFDEQVILYFDGTKEIQQLTDVADIEVEYP